MQMFKFKASLHGKFQDSMERPCLQNKCSSYVTLKFCLAGLKAYIKNLLSLYSPSLQTRVMLLLERELAEQRASGKKNVL